jgi:hypothetical protein
MDNYFVANEVEYWNRILSNNDNPKLLELAFFKIYIKFEKFVSDLFIHYSTGQLNSLNFCPDRILEFRDDTHLNNVLGTKNKNYINYYESITDLSEHIFVNNPFEIITTDANFSNEFVNMKLLRNYIAHESSTSKNKYVKTILNNRDFIEPHEFLIKKRNGTNKSNYTIYIEAIMSTSTFLLEGPVA